MDRSLFQPYDYPPTIDFPGFHSEVRTGMISSQAESPKANHQVYPAAILLDPIGALDSETARQHGLVDPGSAIDAAQVAFGTSFHDQRVHLQEKLRGQPSAPYYLPQGQIGVDDYDC